MIPCNLSIVNS